MAFPWVVTSTGLGGVYFMMGAPEGSIESGFMEQPGIERFLKIRAKFEKVCCKICAEI